MPNQRDFHGSFKDFERGFCDIFKTFSRHISGIFIVKFE